MARAIFFGPTLIGHQRFSAFSTFSEAMSTPSGPAAVSKASLTAEEMDAAAVASVATSPQPRFGSTAAVEEDHDKSLGDATPLPEAFDNWLRGSLSPLLPEDDDLDLIAIEKWADLAAEAVARDQVNTTSARVWVGSAECPLACSHLLCSCSLRLFHVTSNSTHATHRITPGSHRIQACLSTRGCTQRRFGVYIRNG
jgi:hypothetical protein